MFLCVEFQPGIEYPNESQGSIDSYEKLTKIQET